MQMVTLGATQDNSDDNASVGMLGCDGTDKSYGRLDKFCIVRRAVGERNKMLRFVMSPEGLVVPDILEKMPGRGVWITADADTLRVASNPKIFTYAFRRKVNVPDGMHELIYSKLKECIINLIALARKSSFIVYGFEKVKDAILKNDVACLVFAKDYSMSHSGKLRTDGIPVISCLTAESLGSIFGRASVTYTAIRHGSAFPDRLLRESNRFKQLFDA